MQCVSTAVLLLHRAESSLCHAGPASWCGWGQLATDAAGSRAALTHLSPSALVARQARVLRGGKLSPQSPLSDKSVCCRADIVPTIMSSRSIPFAESALLHLQLHSPLHSGVDCSMHDWRSCTTHRWRQPTLAAQPAAQPLAYGIAKNSASVRGVRGSHRPRDAAPCAALSCLAVRSG